MVWQVEAVRGEQAHKSYNDRIQNIKHVFLRANTKFTKYHIVVSDIQMEEGLISEAGYLYYS